VNWTIEDFEGREVELSGKQLDHSFRSTPLDDDEKQKRIRETLERPFLITASNHDPEARLYYRRYPSPKPLVCVVVVVKSADEAFVATAYTASKVKRGAILWRE
jgi:hypothetical protein